MKYVFFIISIYVHQPVISQEYIPTLIDQNNWIVYEGYDDFTVIYYTGYHLEGDTLINGSNYKKLFQFGVTMDAEDNLVLTDGVLNGPVGIMREDIVEKKVYGRLLDSANMGLINCQEFYWNGGMGDVLLHDYNIEINDTLNVCHEDMDNHLIIYDNYTQNLYNKDRETWIFGSGLIIEGVGSDVGPFGTFRDFFHASYGHGLSHFYQGPIEDISQFSTGIKDDLDEDEYNIFPNPVSNLIHVVTSETNLKYRIYNFMGQLELSDQLNDDLINRVINVSTLIKGQYIIEISADENLIRKSFIKF